MFYLLQRNSFKNDEKCFLFHLKSYLRSQDVLKISFSKFLSELFGPAEKTAWLER